MKYIYNLIKNNQNLKIKDLYEKNLTMNFLYDICKKFNLIYINTCVKNISLSKEAITYFKLRNLSINIFNHNIYINENFLINAYIDNEINNNDLEMLYKSLKYLNFIARPNDKLYVYGERKNIIELIKYLNLNFNINISKEVKLC